jgi:hypothetical protein
MMKTTILACACGLFTATGCAVQQGYGGGGMMGAQPEQRSGFGMMAAVPSRRPEPSDLFGAAARGDLPGVQGALAQGASVDGRNAAGATALLLASTNGSLPVIQTLLSAGADVNASDNNGRTPLAAATAGGYEEIARVLRAAGARGAPGEPAPGGAAGQWWQKDGSAH